MADKYPAEVLADYTAASFGNIGPMMEVSIMLRRIPALEIERDQLREQLETLKARFREAAADAVESMPAGLLTCDAMGSASDSYVAQWKAAEVLRNLDLK